MWFLKSLFGKCGRILRICVRIDCREYLYKIVRIFESIITRKIPALIYVTCRLSTAGNYSSASCRRFFLEEKKVHILIINSLGRTLMVIYDENLQFIEISKFRFLRENKIKIIAFESRPNKKCKYQNSALEPITYY